MRYIIEIEKYPNKDYTLHIYEGLNIFEPVLSIKSPKHWNKIIEAICIFLTGKKFVNIFQSKALKNKLSEGEQWTYFF